MKTCPDCAESVQDAARKCRYCGYRFAAEAEDAEAGAGEAADEAPTVPSREPDATAAVAAVSRGPSPGFVLVALGGAGVFVGGLAGSLAVAVGGEAIGLRLAPFQLGGLVLGGLLLAIGWGLTSARGQGGIGGLVGALALVAGQLAGLAVGTADGPTVPALLASAGMIACLFLHLGTLEEAGFDGTRLAAMLGLFGVGGELFSFVKQWDLPAWIGITFGWCGLGGVVLFGLALAVAAMLRWRER